MLLAEGRLDEALERLLRSESVRPRQPGIHAEIGAVYARQGNRAEARRGFTKELRQNANDATSLRGLGKLHLEAGEYEAALEHLLAAAALQEVAPETHYCLARTLHAMNRPTEAARAIAKALRQAPDYPEAIAFQGVIAAEPL